MSHSPKSLVGKTIAHAAFLRNDKYDDTGWLRLRFSDGTSVVIISSYGGWSSKSQDEYPTNIDISEDDMSNDMKEIP